MSTVHTDTSMEAYGTTLRSGTHDAGSRGHYEVQGFWSGEHRALAHMTISELLKVSLTLEEFAEHCLIHGGEVIHSFRVNTIVMYAVQATVSQFPLLMAELRRLHASLGRFGASLQMHHLPSALNLYASRPSRRRRALYFLPRMPHVPDH